MSARTTEEDVLSFLGLASRAGEVSAGTERTRQALREGRAHLVLTAGDASTAQLEKVAGLIRHNDVPRRAVADRARLGRAIGRSPVSAVAVTAASFAQQLLERLPDDASDGERPEQRR